MSKTLPAVHRCLAQPMRDLILASRYRLIEPIGRGGCGEVWSAADLAKYSTRVAVKFLHADAGPEIYERFRLEVRTLKLLQPHPHIVRLLDESDSEGIPFLVMERLDLSLHDWLERHRKQGVLPDFGVVSHLLFQICDALEHAHRFVEGGPITHRDINPRNIMLTTGAQGALIAKVLDFGIARMGKRHLTCTGQQLGTPGYMPPEQACGHHALQSPASDVYALGVLAVELLTLEKSGSSDSFLKSLTALSSSEISWQLATRRPDMPPAVATVIACALEKQPTLRFQHAGGFREAFVRAVPPAAWARGPALEPPRYVAPSVTAEHLAVPEPVTQLHTAAQTRLILEHDWLPALLPAPGSQVSVHSASSSGLSALAKWLKAIMLGFWQRLRSSRIQESVTVTLLPSVAEPPTDRSIDCAIQRPVSTTSEWSTDGSGEITPSPTHPSSTLP